MKDKYSLERVAKLHPAVRKTFTDFIDECENTFNITLRIIQGMRSIAEQNALYAQGRTKPGNKVTNAPGGKSMHNYALAIDVAEILNGDVNWNFDYSKLYPIAKKYGIECGGLWKTIVDKPHFQLSFGYPNDCKALLQKIKNKDVDKDGYVNL